MNTKTTDKTTNWNAILNKPNMARYSIDFALGLMSSEAYKELGSFFGCGGHTRNLVRYHGSHKAREIARKALKRRNLLDKHNLINPLVYGQL